MKPLILLLISLFFISLSEAKDACWQYEKNTVTKQKFTEESWSLALENWREVMPEEVSYFTLFKAWTLYRSEEKNLLEIKDDKEKHCFLGCRITQDISIKTSIYLAWYKELKDLTDCNSKTLFESLDADATLQGAEFGQQTNNPEECLNYCSLN